MELLIEVSNKIYNIVELVTSISWTDKLNDGCSKLEFSYKDDDLKIANGCIVRFKYNGSNIFYGVVFKHSRNRYGEVSVTSYDQLRYAKAKDTVAIKSDTVTTLVSKMCTYFGLIKGTLSDTGYKLPTGYHSDKTWIDIIYSGISETLTNKGKWYSLRDEFGKVCLRELEELKLNLVLGDESLVYDFEHEVSIDDNFYNQIKLVSENESTGKADVYITKDSKSINTYGLLQYYEALDKNANASQAKAKADMLLKLYNQEVNTLSLKCLGDTSVRAGNSFYAIMSDIGITKLKRLIVRSVTHNFVPVHTMDLEVSM